MKSIHPFTLPIFLLILLIGCDAADKTIVTSQTKQSPTQKMTLDSEDQEQIYILVRSGFYDKKRILEIVCEEIHEPGDIDAKQITPLIESEFAKLETEKQSWPDVTDCNRLDKAFAAINSRGIIALQNAGHTQSDGYEDFLEAYSKHPAPKSIIGYCYFHGQDLEGAVNGEGLFLSFGPLDAKNEELKGSSVGMIIREELERVGLVVDWNGSFATRINLPHIVWRRR